MIRFFAALTLSALALLAPAATLERLTLDEMILRSTAIVRGRVTASYAAPQGPIIYTHYQVQVDERLKGAGAANEDVVIPGGSSGGVRQSFSGAPGLKTGSDYILFLWQSRSGLRHVIGLSQGIFTLGSDGKGGLMVRRAAISESMIDSAGRRVTSPPIEMSVDQLSNRIRRVLGTAAAR